VDRANQYSIQFSSQWFKKKEWVNQAEDGGNGKNCLESKIKTVCCGRAR